MPKANKADNRRNNNRVALPPKAPTKEDRKQLMERPVVGDPAAMIPEHLARREKLNLKTRAV